MIRKHLARLVAGLALFVGHERKPRMRIPPRLLPQTEVWRDPQPKKMRALSGSRRRPKDWYKRRKVRMQMVRESRRRNRGL